MYIFESNEINNWERMSFKLDRLKIFVYFAYELIKTVAIIF